MEQMSFLNVIVSLSYYCVVAVLLLVVAVFSSFTLYIHYVHWKYSHIPSPKRSSFYLGHTSDLIKKRKETGDDDTPLYVYFKEWFISAGSPVYVIFFIWKVTVVTLDPEDIKSVIMQPRNGKPEKFLKNLKCMYGERFVGNGLFTIADYDTWKPRRKLYDPAFKKSFLKSLVPSFNECVDQFLTSLRPLADGRTQVSMTQQFSELTLDVISKVGFNYDFKLHTWTDEELGLKRTRGAGNITFLLRHTLKGFTKIIRSPFPELVPYLNPFEAEGYRETTRAIRTIGRDCIQKRIKAMKNGEPSGNDILAHIIEVIKTGEEIDLEDLVDDFFTFYVAGQETTSVTLAFALILLQYHPHVLERLLSEVDEVLGDKVGVTVEDLEQLQYTEQVLMETLRLYPPLLRVNKCAQKGGVTIGGYHIPEGTFLSLPTSLLCRMPEYFDDPDDFDPSRFDPGRKKPSSFVFFPFGIGHRSCIGKNFALMEAKIVLARLLQTFRVSLLPDYKFRAAGGSLLHPKYEAVCTLECR